MTVPSLCLRMRSIDRRVGGALVVAAGADVLEPERSVEADGVAVVVVGAQVELRRARGEDGLRRRAAVSAAPMPLAACGFATASVRR